MGLLFRNHSNPSPMEGETSKLKAYQEGQTDVASEKVFMQKMLEWFLIGLRYRTQ